MEPPRQTRDMQALLRYYYVIIMFLFYYYYVSIIMLYSTRIVFKSTIFHGTETTVPMSEERRLWFEEALRGPYENAVEYVSLDYASSIESD